MTLFNDLNFKIMKLTLYAVTKINYPSYFSLFPACTWYQSIELVETNNLSYF